MLPWASPPPPDFSSRGTAVLPPNLSGRTPPPQKEMPVGSGPINYNVPKPLPPFNPQPAKTQPQPSQPSQPSTATVRSTSITDPASSGYSPAMETFPSLGTSYFLTESGVMADVGKWSKFPAISTVDMSGNDITAVGSIVGDGQGTLTGFTTVTLSGPLTAESATIDGLTATTGNFGGRVTTQDLSVDSGAITLVDASGSQLLRAIGGDLFFNNELLARAGDIQDIADWSLYPALANVNVDGKNVTNVSQLTDVSGAFGSAGQLLSSDGSKIKWVTPTPAVAVNSLNGQTGAVSLTSSGSTVAITNPVAGTINLEVSSGSSASNWANFPAVANVTIPDHDLNMTNAQGGLGSFSTANINANVNIGNVQNAPFRPSFNAIVESFNIGSIVSPPTSVSIYSLGGVNINSLVGVSLAGGGGISIAGVGGINIAGVGALTVSAGGILVTGGGVVVSAGGLAVNGGGIQIGAGGLAVTGGDVSIPGGQFTMGSPSQVSAGQTIYGGNLRLLPSGSTNSALLTEFIGSTTFGPTLAINNVATINGAPYPPPGGSAAGPAGAIQYTDGSGAFQGNTGLVYDGISKLTNATAGNFFDINDAVNSNGISMQATSGQVNITAGTQMGLSSNDVLTLTAGTALSVDINNSTGTAGQVLTATGTGVTTWATPSGGALDLNGLLNKINAFPALPYTTASSSTPAANQVATAIVPDGSFPVNVPTVGAVQGGWGFSKANGSAAYFNWYQYNPRFGAPAAPLPYVKSKIQSAWALIRPTVNLYLPGLLAINLYSFDDANPPTSSFFNTRWAYSNSTGSVAGATGTNLYAGYTYLLYANDSPRITNTAAIGVPDSQVSTLRDPYDIYTDVNHIPLQNCIVAFNPWTDGTNYKTWSALPPTPFLVGATVIFAGQGTNYNGLFFIAGPGIPAPATPPMVNGVVSANWALITPQPSSFADQPIAGITLTQTTATGQAVGYVVLDIGFSYGPSTTSTTVSQHISLLPN